LYLKIREKCMDKLPHDCIIKLLAVYNSLKTAEKKAANILIEETELFRTSTVFEVAEAANCSDATIVRLAQKLGYSGFAELKAELMDVKDKKSTKLYDTISKVDDYETIIKKVLDASIQSLKDTANVININEFGKAVDSLCNAEKIVFCGEGDASIVARAGYLKFIRVGLNATVALETDAQLVAITSLSENDVLIAISHSGRTKNIFDLVKYARLQGIKIISITNYPLSPLARNSDVLLLTASFAESIMGEIMSKRIAELFILESLYINIILKRKDELEANLEKSNRALQVNKIRSYTGKNLYSKRQ
jgi:RpiR family transcriptional regulator, carbohydrate utilization regulator